MNIKPVLGKHLKIRRPAWSSTAHGSETPNALLAEMFKTHRFALTLVAIGTAFILNGCGTKKLPPNSGGETIKPITDAVSSDRPRKGSRVDQILRVAEDEWDFFGKQTVVIDDTHESMPLVGKWEDDGETWANRVNVYWRSVGKPRLDGYDCKQPWSAAFISWVMQTAGLTDSEFPPSDAHWNYIRYFAGNHQAMAAFIPHKINDYTPRPGDLICATRGNSGFIPVYDAMDTGSVLMGHTKLHCDIVTDVRGNQLEALGGNVRNSVTKSTIATSPNGRLKPSERRPWFVVLENRLPR
jgi:hypothetical protein